MESKLRELCRLLIDQEIARIVVEPYDRSRGHWFGGGNLVAGPKGELYLVGRYRNQGDSRTGVARGTRGLELAVFRSDDQGRSFRKVLALSKQDLSLPAMSVLSIEGTALRWNGDRFQLFVSTEKDGVGYPRPFQSYLKSGTGVWSIDCLEAESVESLASATVSPCLASDDPEHIHVKDPFLFESDRGLMLLFCSHPFNWTCSNTGFAHCGSAGDPGRPTYGFFPRGNVWDVAIARGTCVVNVPKLGVFAESDLQLMFYDGGECVRDHEQHAQSVERPRGHSCEEIGGAAWFADQQWDRPHRLSRYEPLFVSPYGTGCSRYVDVLDRPEGMYATWQQAQQDGSQPLVMNFVSREAIESVLAPSLP
ncbi:hypothetical protein [Roseiconus nitratireducens]|nr:hypothetical protein [Roseiconus nitratireducens]